MKEVVQFDFNSGVFYEDVTSCITYQIKYKSQ